jgi:cobalt-zinc-cadmium efflux system outer membrane protein
MHCRLRRALALVPLFVATSRARAASPMTWEEATARFQRNNPSLIAQRSLIDETRANEITAGLRPNPQVSLTVDQWHLFRTNPLRPFGSSQTIGSVTELMERRNKRGLRVESAQLATSMVSTDTEDLGRQLLFNLRDAFVRLLEAKSVLELARENSSSYDRVIAVNKRRLDAGDIARADFERLALQRAQYEADLQSALVNVRTAKIQLLSLMNERTPVDDFDIAGAFDFGEQILLADELHRIAVDARGDLRSAATAIRKAEVDHKLAWAGGAWDPQVGGDFSRIGPDNTVAWISPSRCASSTATRARRPARRWRCGVRSRPATPP